MTEWNFDVWHLPCSLSLASCRYHAEALARRLHSKLWSAGRFGNSEDSHLGGELSCDTFRLTNSFNEHSVIIPVINKAPVSKLSPVSNTVDIEGWKETMFTCEDELCNPEDDSSPPSPTGENIVVNKAVNLIGAMDSSDKTQHSPKTVYSHPCGSRAIGESWRENDFRHAQVMDRSKRQILFEKLQKYAESWSLSEPETGTSARFYDVDSGSDSVEELDLNGLKDESEILHVYDGQEDDRNVNKSSDPSKENTLTSLQRGPEEPPHDCPISLVTVNETITNSNSMGDSGITSPTSADLETCNGPNKKNSTLDSTAFKSKEGESSDLTDCSCRLSQDINYHDGKEGKSSDLTDSSCRLSQDTNDHYEEYENGLVENTTESVLTREGTRKSLYSSVDESVQTSDPDSLNRLLEESSQNEKSEHVESKWNALNGHEEEEDSGKKLVRSTSLKTGKTPPGTPSRKKIVCFADALGLDLEAVRHIGPEDEELNIPASAFSDLKVSSHTSGRSSTSLISQTNPFACSLNVHKPSHSSCTLIPLFPQPITRNDFLDRIRSQKICLENIIASDLNVKCHVRVLNISFEKLVLARYTTNEWLTYDDVLANYVHGSCDGWSDKFSLNFLVPGMSQGQRLIFAVRFLANGQEFWDNNDGKNYILRCHSQSSGVFGPLTEGGPPWMHHFM
ncbi:glycogen-binding subunit 76A-like [Limulus polyphemus]|uniref:Glycogen-binding subunit 76A-like n=1 Tax=Limulus polyphemus TaxID=6850 RepID=A0ABM1BEE7_LIMPO|nr:glycogen-binding subunit 76A-like [Limulus polyphemus]